MIIATKYCGGCRAVYDRVNAAKKIKQALEGCTFVPFNYEEVYDAVIVITGCMSACVDLRDAAKIVVNIREEADVRRAIASLKKLC